jgi:hypothetical protein
MTIDKAQVVIPGDLNSPPEPHEVDAAWILARHYNTTVTFIKPRSSYKIKTPDITMNSLDWELKCPIGKSKKHTIKEQFERAKGKRYLIIDGRHAGLDDDYIMSRFSFELQKHKDIKKLIFITKEKNILVIK